MLWLHSGEKCGSEIWISIIMQRSGRNRGLSRQLGWLTDSSRMVLPVYQTDTFTPGLSASQICRIHCFTPLMSYTDTKKMAVVFHPDEIWRGASALSLCTFVFDYMHIYMCCLPCAVELLAMQRGKMRLLNMILSSFASEYRDSGQN